MDRERDVRNILDLVIACAKSSRSHYLDLDTMSIRTTNETEKPDFFSESYYIGSSKATTYHRYFSALKSDRTAAEMITSSTTGVIDTISNLLWPTVEEEMPAGREPPKSKIWRKYCGSSLDGKCFCCKGDITFEKWNATTMIKVSSGGSNEISNLRPTCDKCYEASPHSIHMYEYIKKRGYKTDTDTKADPLMRFFGSLVSMCKDGEKKIKKLHSDSRISDLDRDTLMERMWHSSDIQMRVLSYSRVLELHNKYDL